MSRRVHPCTSCRGMTRHRGPCARCRRNPIRMGRTRLIQLPTVHDPKAPTQAELARGMDLSTFITDVQLNPTGATP